VCLRVLRLFLVCVRDVCLLFVLPGLLLVGIENKSLGS
jgi:hypothetical protein